MNHPTDKEEWIRVEADSNPVPIVLSDESQRGESPAHAKAPLTSNFLRVVVAAVFVVSLMSIYATSRKSGAATTPAQGEPPADTRAAQPRIPAAPTARPQVTPNEKIGSRRGVARQPAPALPKPQSTPPTRPPRAESPPLRAPVPPPVPGKTAVPTRPSPPVTTTPQTRSAMPQPPVTTPKPAPATEREPAASRREHEAGRVSMTQPPVATPNPVSQNTGGTHVIWPKLQFAGSVPKGGGRYAAVIAGVGVAEQGDVIQMVRYGIKYTWEVTAVSARDFSCRPLSADPYSSTP